jgi:HK97 family phage major capsid protein|nr:MAG TPA_asm: major capsid protein [Caudoviricetes sp.]
MTVKEMKARLRAINAEAAKIKEGDKEALDKLLLEAEDLSAKIEEAESRARLQRMAVGAADPTGEPKPGENGNNPEDSATKRGKALMVGNKVSRKFAPKNAISSTSTVLTQHTASDVKPTFNEVSSLVDRVKAVPLPGGESYKRGFVKGYGTGGHTAEGADYNTAEPTFGYAEMTKTKITAYCEEPEEIAKLAPADYDGVISGSTEIAVRKFLSKQILIGQGGAGKLYGIFYNPKDSNDDIIDRNTDISIPAIDKNTLDEIIYAYGGDEDVEDIATLILNKMDLKAFATLRLEDGKKAYTVVNHGNTGTIDGVPYIINSACNAVSNSATTAGSYCMAYGPLSNYELPVFSDMDIQRSTEFKFKQGQIAHRADIFVGGNVAAYNGFLRVKKKSV